ncbi:efflux RND transporter periplasmic adaptor subunit [Zwartia vadi]|uniref:efflux RND transporter periplasmic adaptor subunit n=1 Tax=Zwartia vadi TaxID=3058168 RepID=UPI0025B53A8C|nr:efflux RND transporter periplasmic adaptor subunit [Zwartia vadi]MDN3986302.1 efflux RND transporter periplasmic adaptor subunit [Zwartia vadi]
MKTFWKNPPRLIIGLVVVGIIVTAGIFWQRWRGPLVPAYQIESSPLVQIVVATGRVISASRVQIGSEVTGVVTERRVQEGDQVFVNDILVILRSDEISAKVREAQAALDQLRNARRPQAQAALAQAESQFLQASREAQRRRELFLMQSISREVKEQSEHLENTARANAEQARLLVASLAEGASEETILRERLQSAKASLEKSLVRSQIDGKVLTRNVEPGDLVQPGRVLLEIARTGKTEILVPLDERNLGVLRLGQEALCTTDAYPGRNFKARVSFIAPTVDPQRGTVDIRLTVDPVPDFLRQDMTVTVNILTGQRAQTLSVPNDTLMHSQGERAELFTVLDEKIRRIEVGLGLRGLVMTEVVSGLRAGDWVMALPTEKSASKNDALQDGTRVRIKPLALPSSVSERDANTGKTDRKETPVKFN